MANSNRVFVSPGVYTSEKDLTFVAQSVGVTTLGAVGETLSGPAFEPVLINNYDDFKLFFGGSSPVKDGEGNPRYELPYVAKSYLQESNQMFVTRILGLTGYKAGISFGLVADTGHILLVLRSRGYYDTGGTLNYEVTTGGVAITGLTGSTLSDFDLTVNGITFTCNLDITSNKFISKVLGTENFDKPHAEFPLYVHEVYPYLAAGLPSGTTVSTTVEEYDEVDNFRREWDTAASPWVVSEVRGGNVAELFKVVTISDGNSSNRMVKVMINNIDLERSEFDVIVRDFYDTDDNMVGLEKFTRCSMDPSKPSYVAKKIGTADGEYELKSKFIMLSMYEGHPLDAVPAGFRGYPTNNDFNGYTLGGLNYKTQYYDAGENDLVPNGDKVRRVSLGLSTQSGHQYDEDMFTYKGLSGNGITEGFHLSVEASGVTANTLSGLAFITTLYDLEGVDKGKLSDMRYRKFTFAPAGGYDGWDIYRQTRTYGDAFIFNKPDYLSNLISSGGTFNATVGNSDYYAYLQGIQTYASPEAIDINVFTTCGINFVDHSSLTLQAIDMIENDRSDSLYVINSKNRSTSEQIIDDLDFVDIDSNYSATYWPWIQVRDEDNQVQLYIPPTGEVLRNIALTDNVKYPWFATAGYSRGIVKSVRALKKLTLDERDNLYKNRINPIATFSDTGTIIWGNKTLQIKESPLDRINVRRLLLRARKLISAVAVRLLFEQNDDQVRNEFLRLVNPILEAIKKENGLTDFRVTVSNDPEDIDNNTMRGKIYIKPTKALEYIDLEFIITPAGASFENI